MKADLDMRYGGNSWRTGGKPQPARKLSDVDIENYSQVVENESERDEPRYESEFRGRVQNRAVEAVPCQPYRLTFYHRANDLRRSAPYYRPLEALNGRKVFTAPLYLGCSDVPLTSDQARERLVSIDKVAYAPLRNAPRLSVLITAIGVSYFLENGAQLLFGADAKVVPSFAPVSSIQAGGLSLSFVAIITVLVTAVSTVVLTFLVQRTKLGKAMRAVSEDMGAARLMGVNVNNTITFTFAVGSALAGIGAVLYVMAYPQATPTMGMMLGTKAFVAAVLGGIGSIPGAVVGAMLVGFSEVFVSAIGLSVWRDAVVFLLLIIVLIVRPTGIFGRTMSEKV